MMFEEAKFEDGDTEQLTYKDCPRGKNGTPSEPGSKLLVLGMGNLQPLTGNPFNGYINPYYWVDEFIPYYMEI